MSSELKTYRHTETDVVAQYDPRMAEAHPFLVEVREEAEPAAPTPAPRTAPIAARPKTKNKSGDAPRDKKEEE